MTLLSSISLEETGSSPAVDVATNREAFKAYVERVLVLRYVAVRYSSEG